MEIFLFLRFDRESDVSGGGQQQPSVDHQKRFDAQQQFAQDQRPQRRRYSRHFQFLPLDGSSKGRVRRSKVKGHWSLDSH